jgi:hypothetical protein
MAVTSIAWRVTARVPRRPGMAGSLRSFLVLAMDADDATRRLTSQYPSAVIGSVAAVHGDVYELV